MEELYQACCAIPCDLVKIRRLLETKHYTPKELTQTAQRFVMDDCTFDSDDFCRENGREPERRELAVHNLYELLTLLLEFGLDPNAIGDDGNIMSQLCYVYNGYDAANSMRLLLENGGNPNLMLEDYSICGWMGVRVSFDLSEYGPDDLDDMIHTWFVLLGYGSRSSTGEEQIDMKNGHSVEELRQHEQYHYVVERHSAEWNDWTMHIIQKDTGEEIAIF